MKKSLFFCFLLFLLFGLCSCPWEKNINTYYKSMVEDNDRQSTLIYMILAQDSQQKEAGYSYFVEQNFSDSIIVTVLDPSTSLESAITVYKSYSNLKDYEKAKEILSDYLIKGMSLKEIVTLIVNYPVDSDYITTMFGLWQTTLSVSEKKDFLLLLKRFANPDNLTESSAKTIIDIATRLEEDMFYNEDDLLLADIYEIKADILEMLRDNTNANAYRRLSDSLRNQ